jgi:hypothetical protein
MTESFNEERMEGDLVAAENNSMASKSTPEKEPSDELRVRPISLSQDHAELPPPPALTVQTHIHRDEQLPGAYHVFPGDADGDESAEEDEIDPLQSSTGHDPRRQQAGIGEIYLVEADLVAERTESEAEIYPAILVDDRPVRRYNWWLLLGLGLLMIGGLSLGVYFGLGTANDQAAAPVSPSFKPSSIPSSSPTVAPSSLPSEWPSISPSAPPSFAPSRPDTPRFRSSLPGFTQQALLNTTSPQWMAFEWVTGNDKRHNISRMKQRFSLATLFYATAGETNWKNRSGWLRATTHECKWYGCYCPDNRTITAIGLQSNKLRGSLPEEVYLLDSLEFIQLELNRELIGKLTSNIGTLRTLKLLKMHGTNLSGRLPTELGLLTNLSGISLSATYVTGSIPTEIGNLHQLRSFDLGYARLRGSIPTELGGLSLLQTLDLSENRLSSTVPAELRNLSYLEDLNLSDNNLTGTLPSELSSLSALRTLSFTSNALRGSIPPEYGRLSLLNTCFLENNKLLGSIPTELGNMSSLFQLNLNGNNLNGTIPTELGLLTNLQSLSLYQNSLSGTVPSKLCNLVATGLELDVDCGEVNCSCCDRCT